MHHAFPRECPSPHEAGTTFPQTADEWIAQTGQESTQASEEEMTCHVSGPCGGAASDDQAAVSMELPWLDAEELLVPASASSVSSSGSRNAASSPYVNPYAQPPKAAKQVSKNSTPTPPSFLDSAARLLRTLALAGTALGLATVSRFLVPQSSSDTETSKKGLAGGHRGVGSWITVGLFLFPLTVISADYVMDYEEGNAFFVCGLCWSLAFLTIFQFQVLQAWHVRGTTAPPADSLSLDKCLV
jgi:hypothetical protein